MVEKYRAVIDRNQPRSSTILSDDLDLIVGRIVFGGSGHLYGRGIEEDKRALFYPFERIDRPDAKTLRGGIVILHSLQDMMLPAEHSERFVAKAREVFKGKPGGDRISDAQGRGSWV
ncbi:uncharacterized protein ACLA_059770 [Aspergillus clavatus NRRL 1]|uniref:Uncharacterized protein n=1 Tax=Aspergillus clavatus (strain ATCC 1007 / CBS 513.65 / DSM 816 / NCTC 3887 / NRRL 1 / QM 1276 / 107) TaxID=344612 RepID=A1C4H0_ASPCL|nr:uncharacterized protein ACLA_059770 [Aspergillus clavatus NRRL 1]EAW15310.1 hypothetical protein ACLA_059770 [Aspergillus clavatus NRRL 1]